MNGKKTKAIRKLIYKDLSLKDRKYFKNPDTIQIIADDIRRLYKLTKRMIKQQHFNWKEFCKDPRRFRHARA